MISEVRLVRLTSIGRVYASLQEAFASDEGSHRVERSRRDNATLQRTQIIDFHIGSTSVELLLSDLRLLRIFCVGDQVDWAIEEGGQLSPGPDEYAEEVQVTWTSEIVTTWDPESLLIDLTGVTGIFLGPSEDWLFLAVRGQTELVFKPITDEHGTRLHFGEA
jgi:hypothetical protein